MVDRKTIMGIDLAGYSTGVAVVSSDGKMVCHEAVRADRKAPFWDRLELMANTISGLIKKYSPSLLVTEKIRLYHHGKISYSAIVDLSRLQGAIGYVARLQSVPVEEVHTRHWRKVVLGDGKATKGDVVKWASCVFGEQMSEDEAEAAALAAYGVVLKTKWFRRRGGYGRGSSARRQ